MKIGIQNCWPNLEYSAEREFIARFKRSCLKLDWVCIEVITSQDIIEANVDCVIVTHEFSPKLTNIPTIGLLWSPPEFYRDDPIRVRSILSYDGYLAGSDSVRQYLEDLFFSTGRVCLISDWDFLPTAPSTIFNPPSLQDPSLFYAGVHWDNNRHKELMHGLSKSLPIEFHGDPERWARFGKSYKGNIPFDGFSIFEKIRAAGVALCLHRDEHLKHGVPSMRIFESAAAGAVIITEDSTFAVSNFGDSILYVAQSASDASKLIQIQNHYKWVCTHPIEALELATKSHAIFVQKFSLESMLAGLPTFLDKIRIGNHFSGDMVDISTAKVEVIVRIGGRSLFYIERCLDSIAAQSYPYIGLTLVSYKEIVGLDRLLEKYAVRFEIIKRIASDPTGFRSTSLWDGMRTLDGEYFCNQDDDDTMHPNHVSSLVALLASDDTAQVAYSGCIQVQDEPGHYYDQPNFRGPIGLKIPENRQLIFLEQFNRERLLRFDNFVQSNAWLARSSILKARDLIDPKLVVVEDMYLYFLFLRSGDFLFSWRPTANWHWRSTSKDNSMMMETCQAESGQRVRLRTQFFGLSEEPLTILDVLRPFVSYLWKRYPRLKKSFQYLRKKLTQEV